MMEAKLGKRLKIGGPDKLSAQEKEILGSLNFCLSFGATPFELMAASRGNDFLNSGEGFLPEVRLGSDEWAWQFLRVNPEFQNAFKEARAFYLERELPVDGEWLGRGAPGPALRCVKSYDQANCRSRFGLSAWVDPSTNRLPTLPVSGSWFFPLRQVRFSEIKILQSSWSPVVEGMFKYHRQSPGPHGVANGYLRSSACCFGIDCSVPPFAQIESVSEIAEAWSWYAQRTKRLLKADQNSRNGKPMLGVFNPGEEIFDPYDLPVPQAPTNKILPSGSHLWRELRIDCLRALSPQLRRAEGELLSVYQKFAENGLAQGPIRQRFNYQQPNDKSSGYRDGHPLKALIMVNGLMKQLASIADVERLLYKTPSGHIRPGALGKGSVTYSPRLSNYKRDASLFVDGGYRWLVHTTKLNDSE
jgi:hypothetical protein